MTSRELIKRIINHDAPQRIGHEFSQKSNDIAWVAGVRFQSDARRAELRQWGRHEALLREVPGFGGEVREDEFGNIHGRLDGKTKGECVKGFLQDGWEREYHLPEPDFAYYDELLAHDLRASEKFVVSYLPFSVFSTLRDMRHMPNALMDVLLEPDNVRAFLEKITEAAEKVIPRLARVGVDTVIIADDWGVQDRTFIGRAPFCELFVPAYRKIADALHENRMHFMLHSCGKILDFIRPLIEAGVDVFQFDQPEVYGTRFLAEEFGGEVTFYSPVDVQKVLPTGDRTFIEAKAFEMVENFKTLCGGALIVKDYPSYADIGVSEEWAGWARDMVIANSGIFSSDSN